ncbi:MAG: aspartate--ammonia ligase [Bacteroidales bacterium]|nr:aspartate--ammonia ligase [Bacteroidales bacterium]MCD8387671.1 aspartate--ammonia ligase [Bacteroidales bacterium]
MKVQIPDGYRPLLDLKQTEQAIKLIKDFFLDSLSTELRLRRVTAPLFVLRGLGINDDLNGVERPVTFPIKDMDEATAEVVHSLAKWKRLTLAEYDIPPGYGVVTDMNAIRADEELDNIHSMYVDQWDWERTIRPEDRNIDYLKRIVRKIYNTILRTEFFISEKYPQIKPYLPEEVTFIHSQQLLAMYPDLSPKEREDEICRLYGAVFIIGIGGKLSDGQPHDLRAPDYDDWTTLDEATGLAGLNGDLMIWYPVLGHALELSSMGIRVDPAAMERQLILTGKTDRKDLYFHQQLLSGKLPLSIGGGIGQSRLCMCLLQKGHIGETQSSIWPPSMRRQCADAGMPLMG